MTARHGRALSLAAALLAGGALWPAPAFAHGLVQRANLPLPEWLFAWAAGVVLVLSFVALAILWPEPRLERDRWRPLPGSLGRLLGSRAIEVALGALGVGLLALVLVAGFAGSQNALSNFAPTFVFITFWVGLAFASALFGDLFRAVNPWRALGHAAGWTVRRARPARAPERTVYPERLGVWPAVAGLLVFTWIELVSGWSEQPRTLAILVALYSVVTLAGQARYGVETWSARGEAFSVYFNLLSRIAPFETRDRVVGMRPLLGGLPRLTILPGSIAFVAVMIGTVTFDGLSQGGVWSSVRQPFEDAGTAIGLSLENAEKVAATIGIVVCIGLVAGFYALGTRYAHTLAPDLSAARLRRGFVHSLVPIALVYVAAHYLTFLLFEGQGIAYLLSDPLGRGWDLFGTASSAVDYGLISQNQAWYAQVACVVTGHVAALVLAHDRALALYGQARAAARSQYAMLVIMVGFTTLALWLLAQAGTA
ncbi:MAG TPA: fenitrothion hydrolase [Solirubrobacteraceae bacterium]|nr:fenitrothion hydrolase [Solirubrobacteraceae bacterium]